MLGGELSKVLELKEGDKNRDKRFPLWSFVLSMSNNIDGAYVCVHLQSLSAIAFMEDPSRKSDRMQFPQSLKTILVYNDKLGTLCNASKLNVMPTSLSATTFHNDGEEKDRLIRLMNTGKKLAFKMFIRNSVNTRRFAVLMNNTI